MDERKVIRAPKIKKRHLLIVQVAERDGWFCFYCQCRLFHPKDKDLGKTLATLEHVIPRWAGGTNAMTNLAIACAQCNVEAGAKGLKEKLQLKEGKRK